MNLTISAYKERKGLLQRSGVLFCFFYLWRALRIAACMARSDIRSMALALDCLLNFGRMFYICCYVVVMMRRGRGDDIPTRRKCESQTFVLVR